ncbi:MAG TPA: IclR family transcriptional regulator [Solirubrobacteraceae bacterium]|jgi:DNA-binding IclR family transcriptional regulator
MQNELAGAETPGQGAAQSGGVQSIARAGQLLRALQDAPDGLPLGELSLAVGLPKSTVHRLVAALATEGLLGSDRGGMVRLGDALPSLGAAARETLPARLRPVLERLHCKLEETVDLAVLDGGGAKFVDQLAAPHRLRAVSVVGASFPLHCTANGKALLASLSEEHALALLPARLSRLTAQTIVSRAALLAELALVRTTGVAFDREEHTEGICAVGAAVFDRAGLAGAISVPVPTPRFTGRGDGYAVAVLAAAKDASQLLCAVA